MKPLTWQECSAFLQAGDRVRFVEPWDIFPHTMVPAGTPGLVVLNDLDELGNPLWVLPDDAELRTALADWDGEIMLTVDDDAQWDGASPLCIEETGFGKPD